ncbi:hypothetical protein Syun_016972 [Stephania yunnanensis]|uniref:Uncharacterized protein n=1 Tax=Stephania yunnanensis TaxID=152371 RepID=A0AAP0J7M5_9MAGN
MGAGGETTGGGRGRGYGRIGAGMTVGGGDDREGRWVRSVGGDDRGGEGALVGGILGDDDPIYLSLGEIPINESSEEFGTVQVAELIGFQRCMHSCLEYLESVLWVGDEEEEKVLLWLL